MKNKGTFKIFLPLIALIFSLGFSSCRDDDYGPSPYFYDSYLTGYWQLTRIDGVRVPEYQSNYLYFDGYGRGLYYYFDNYGRLYSKTLRYECFDPGYSYSDLQLNILYQGDRYPQSMNYYFSGDGYTLYLWWKEGGRTVTYAYSYLQYFPY